MSLKKREFFIVNILIVRRMGMNRKILKILRSRDGAALPIVMLIFLVTMILISSVMMIFGSNLRQAKHQEELIKAHYIALSGIDLAVAALLQEGTGGLKDTLLYKQFGSQLLLGSTPTLQDTIVLANGRVDIKIHAIDSSGRWVEVRAEGALPSNGAKRVIVLKFLADNPEIQNWNKN